MSKTISLETLKIKLIKRKEDGKSWASMAREYDVNPAVLWRIANEDYNPKKPETREKLDLPEITMQETWRDHLGRFVRKDNA